MDVREQLVEIVCDAMEADGCVGHCNHPPCFAVERVVNALIAHGVTVQEWVSVKDRLPKADGTKVIVTNGVCSWEDFLGVNIWVVQHNSSLKKHKKPVTHWQTYPNHRKENDC